MPRASSPRPGRGRAGPTRWSPLLHASRPRCSGRSSPPARRLASRPTSPQPPTSIRSSRTPPRSRSGPPSLRPTMSGTRRMPQLDAPLEPLRLTAAGGASVALGALAAGAPVVLALLEAEPEPGPRLDMLRELGRRLRGSGAQLVVVTRSESAIAKTLQAEALALCMTDPAANAFAALGLVERGIGRVRRRGGVFVVDGGGVLRFAYVAQRDHEWVPCTFVLGRLQRLGISAEGAEIEPASAPAPVHHLDEEEGGAVEILAGRVGAAMGLSTAALRTLATAARF